MQASAPPPTPGGPLGTEHGAADSAYMREALALARQAAAVGETPVGALVVHGGQVVGRAHNRKETRPSPLAHAELLAIEQAAAALGRWRLLGCTLYVTLEPCAMCAGAAIHARLDRVVYGASDPKAGGCGGLLDVLGHPGHNHHPRLTGGVLAAECGALLSDFFARLRERRHPTGTR